MGLHKPAIANEIVRVLDDGGPSRWDNRSLAYRVDVIVQNHPELAPELDQLLDKIRTIQSGTAKLNNPWGYFRKQIVEIMQEVAGIDYGQLEKQIHVPVKLPVR